MSYGTVSYGEVPYGALNLTEASNDAFAAEGIQLSGEDTFQFLLRNLNGASSITLTESITTIDYWYYSQAESLLLSESNELSEAIAVLASMNLLDSVQHTAVAVSLFLDALSVNAKERIAFRALISDTLTASELLDYKQALGVVEALTLSGLVSSRLVAIAVVAQSIALGSASADTRVLTGESTAALTEAIIAKLIQLDLFADSLQLTDTYVNQLHLYVEMAEDLEAETATQLFQRLNTLINEGIAVALSIRLDGEVYAAMVANPATLGVSRYDNFPFNSMAYAYGKYYAVSDDGVYELAGDNDDGTAIAARIKTGLSNFGERRMKRINDVFLGVLKSGDLVLKVTADEAGARTEAWYRVDNDYGDASNHRVKVGKGLKGIYWGLELVNVEGADFDLDNVQLYPLVLSRKV